MRTIVLFLILGINVSAQVSNTVSFNGVSEYVDLSPWAKQINELLKPNGLYSGDCTYEFWLNNYQNNNYFQGVWSLGNANAYPSFSNPNLTNSYAGNHITLGNASGWIDGEFLSLSLYRKNQSGNGSNNSFGSYSGYDPSVSIFPQTWHHYAIVYSLSTNNIVETKFYLDGNLISTFVTSLYGDYENNQNYVEILNGQPEVTWATIGMRKADELNLPFNGCIDNFRIWNRALDYNEVNNVKNSEINTPQNGLILNLNFEQKENILDYPEEYQDFIDNSTNDYRDFSGNNFHGKYISTVKNTGCERVYLGLEHNNTLDEENKINISKQKENLFLIESEIPMEAISVYNIEGKLLFKKNTNLYYESIKLSNIKTKQIVFFEIILKHGQRKTILQELN